MIKLSDSSKSLLLPTVAFLVGLVALVVALFVVAVSDKRPGSIGGIGGPFALVDQNGRKVTDKDFAGTPFLVFFGFTRCPDVCPTTLYDMSQLLTALGSDAAKVNALFVTVDPDRDAPDVLKQYLSSFDPRIVGLTGSQDAIDQVTKAYRAYARKVASKDGEYTMDHTALVYLMDKTGSFVGSFMLKRPPAEAAAELRRYL